MYFIQLITLIYPLLLELSILCLETKKISLMAEGWIYILWESGTATKVTIYFWWINFILHLDTGNYQIGLGIGRFEQDPSVKFGSD